VWARKQIAGGCSSMMWLGRGSLAALVIAISNGNSFGAQATFEWEDAAFCRFETKFDPAKYDKEKLQNTINAIFSDDFDPRPSPDMGLIGPGGRLTSKTAEYQQKCELAKSKLANLPVIELPGIEDYRRRKLEELEDWCRVDTLESRAATGDPSALREYTPSAAHCSSFIDALEGKTDIRAVWREVVNANCQTNADPKACKSRVVAGENRSDNDDKHQIGCSHIRVGAVFGPLPESQQWAESSFHAGGAPGELSTAIQDQGLPVQRLAVTGGRSRIAMI
jgi:hypothetical protein